jgi:3'-5' exoribonuclease
MIGHLVMETIMVAGKIAELPGFPDDLRRHLLHLLLTHHGKLEYGSPKLPSTPEALLLSMLDDLDSKVEAMQRLMADPLAVGDWTRISPMFERPIYRRRTLDPLPPTSTDQTEREQGATLSGEDQRAGADPVGRRSAGQSAGTFNTPFAGLEGLIK